MFEQYGQRMGIGEYWLTFMACWGVTIGGAIGYMFGGLIGSSFFTMISIVALLASSIWIRVAQMRRCMDIGWWWQIPWGVLGISLAASVIGQFNAVLALVMLPALVLIGLGDFVFGIVLGFMPSKHIVQPDFDAQAYRDSYRDYGAPNASLKLEAMAELRNRDAATRAAVENPVFSASGKRVASVTRSETAPAPPPRAMGFGRKGTFG